MSNVQIYDQEADQTYYITINLNKGVVVGQASGADKYYISVSTNARTPAGGVIDPVILDDSDIDQAFSLEIRDAIVSILNDIQGVGHSSSSSSSSHSESESSNSVSSSSGSSNSSSQTNSASSLSSVSSSSETASSSSISPA